MYDYQVGRTGWDPTRLLVPKKLQGTDTSLLSPTGTGDRASCASLMLCEGRIVTDDRQHEEFDFNHSRLACQTPRPKQEYTQQGGLGSKTQGVARGLVLLCVVLSFL